MANPINENDLSALLDRSNGGPSLYFQIIEIIENMIIEGKICIGDYLPSQDELSRIFKVSRITVRNALQDLNNKGVVVSERAKGARILKIPEKNPQFAGIGFSSRYRSVRLNAVTKIVSIEIGVKHNKISRILTGDGGLELIRMRRLRSLGDIPVAVETSYIVKTEELKNEFKHFSDQSSLYQLLFDIYGIRIGYAEETIQTIDCSDSDIQELLNIDYVPVLYTERSSGEEKAKLPIEYCEIYRVL